MALHDLFPDDRPAAELNGVVRCFEGANEVVVALDHVDAIIPRGRMTVVAGPSGSGKSTLLALLACTQRADEGTVHVGDTELMALGRNERRAVRRDRLGIVLPQPSENLLDRFDATGNVEWAGKQRRNSTSATVDVIALLESVGLAAAHHRRVRELSGGEQQRLAIACALAGGPELVILDEPTASLDRASGHAVVEVLAGVAATGTTLVIASHDAMVIEAAQMLISLDHGRRVQ